MYNKTKILKLIQDNADTLKDYGVKRLGLFGSFVRLDQNRKSDIDILVEFRQGEKGFDNYMELKFFLEKLFRRRVDLVLKEALKKEIKPYIIKEIKYA
jgi:predicted nucleotidyltransferase